MRFPILKMLKALTATSTWTSRKEITHKRLNQQFNLAVQTLNEQKENVTCDVRALEDDKRGVQLLTPSEESKARRTILPNCETATKAQRNSLSARESPKVTAPNRNSSEKDNKSFTLRSNVRKSSCLFHSKLLPCQWVTTRQTWKCAWAICWTISAALALLCSAKWLQESEGALDCCDESLRMITSCWRERVRMKSKAGSNSWFSDSKLTINSA